MTKEQFKEWVQRLINKPSSDAPPPARPERPARKHGRFPDSIERSIRIGETLAERDMPSWQRRVHEDFDRLYDQLGYRRGIDY